LRIGELIFDCDVEHFVKAKRLSGAEKEIRDLLLYGIWKTGQLENKNIGRLFGLSYSGVSHSVRSAKFKLSQSRQLQAKFDQLNSLFKLCPPFAPFAALSALIDRSAVMSRAAVDDGVDDFAMISGHAVSEALDILGTLK
jgi:hypothetical protein